MDWLSLNIETAWAKGGRIDGGRGLLSPFVLRLLRGESERPGKIAKAMTALLLGLFAWQLPKAAHAVNICGRTNQVEQAILAEVTATTCTDVSAAELTSITVLNLQSRQIDTLQADDFSGLSGLTTLDLSYNDLTSLPAGVFSGLFSLTDLSLSNNYLSAGVTILPTAVTVPEGGSGTYEVVLNAPPSGGATVSVSSSDATVASVAPASLSFTASGTGLALVDWNLPKTVTVTGVEDDDLDDETATISHSVSSSDTSYSYSSSIRVSDVAVRVMEPPIALCDRTPAVKRVILSSIGGGVACEDVTLDQLGRIGSLDLRAERERIYSLQANDFYGLSSLTRLDLADNYIISLPEKVFSGLSSLTRLELSNNDITILPEEVFSGLSNLTYLGLGTNSITILPEEVFSGLSNLTYLGLFNNKIKNPPKEVFSGLSSLEELRLNNNNITSLPAGVFSGLSSLIYLRLDRNPLTAGVTVLPTSITVPEGSSGTYEVVLNAPPIQDISHRGAISGPTVHVSISSSDATVASVAPASLSFTASGTGLALVDWNLPKTVTVTAVEDDDLDDETATISHSVSSSDPSYGYSSSIRVSDVAVRVEDTVGVPGVRLLDAEELTTSEGGGTASFRLRLLTQPSANVSITPSSSDASEGSVTGELTFTPDNWNEGQPVTVTGVNDNVVDGRQDYQITFTLSSADTDYDGLSVAAVSISNRDDDPLPLTMDPVAGDDVINIEEKAGGVLISGATGSIEGVSVSVRVGTEEQSSTSGVDGRWSVQLPADSSVISGDSLMVTAEASKDGYADAQQQQRTVTVDLVLPLPPVYSVPDSLQVNVEIADMVPGSVSGDVAQYTAVDLPPGLEIAAATGIISGRPVAAQPATIATVSVADQAGNSSSVNISFPEVEKGDQVLSGFAYSASSASTAKPAPTVIPPSGVRTTLSYAALPESVCSVDDSTGELSLSGAGRCIITASASADANYNAATADFIVEVFLPMEPGEPQGLVATAGDGQVSLSWEAPASDGGAVITDYEVRHALGESVPPEVSWSPAGVDLTEEITGLRNNEEYTFEVRAVNSVSYGNAASTRATPMATKNPVGVPGVRLLDAEELTTSEGGGTASFRLRLLTQPSANVSITPSSSDASEGSVTGELTFTPDNWNEGQPVTVTGVNDNVVDGRQDYQITFTLSSADTDYDGLSVAAVSISNRDDDPLPLTMDPVAGDDAINIEEKAGGVLISGATGSIEGVSVSVRVGTEEQSSTSGVDGRWSVQLPADSSVISGDSLMVTAEASKDGYADAQQQQRTVTVDLVPPLPPAYSVPDSLQVNVEIADMVPGSVSSDVAQYTAVDLPPGLEIAAATGIISGRPVAAQPATIATVSVADQAGNSSSVNISFPEVEKGDQVLSGFAYSASSASTAKPAPTVIPPSGVRTTLSYAALPESVCSVDDSTGELSLSGAGRCTITASASADANYNAAAADFIVEVFLPMEPGEPQGLVATAGDGQVSLSWEAPASDGGAVITDYEVRHALGESVPPEVSWSPAGVDLTEEITGLRNNEEYTFEVRAVNSVSYGNAASTRATPMEPSIGLCDRTPAVKRVILSSIGGGVACEDVTLDQLGRIGSLDLRAERERIYSLQANDFYGLSSLTRLDLADNYIISLPEKVFSGLSSLTRLELSNNDITILPEEVFSGLSNLTYLGLGTNSITILPEEVFSGLSNLTYLGLFNNKIKNPPKEVFSGLSSLEELRLNNNNITSLPAGVFSGLSSLIYLRLDRNPLTAGVTVLPTSITVPEGSSGTYEVVLNAPPIQDISHRGAISGPTVHVSISSSDATVASVAPASLSFTASGTGLALVDWNLPKTVTVTAVEDDDLDDETATISHSVSSSDPSYGYSSSIRVSDVAVRVEDTVGVPGVRLLDAEELTTSEGGGTASFRLRLLTQPSANVSITPSSSDASEGSVTGELTFTPDNWNEGQPVTVTGVNDNVVDGRQDYQITFTLSSADTDYDGLSVAAVSISNRDDDPLPLTMDPVAGDDAINIEEKAEGVLISGATGSIEGVSVSVRVGTEEQSSTSGVDGRWSVQLPADSSVISGDSLMVTAEASKDGYVDAQQQQRTVTVDLVPPLPPAYSVPDSLQVNVEIADMVPGSVSGDVAQYTAVDLPPGLEIAAATGIISGRPVAAQPATIATVSVADQAGNSSSVNISFPEVEKGDQMLSGFAYSASSASTAKPAPTVIPPSDVETTLSYAALPESVCSVDDSTGELSLSGAGRCTITASASADANYNAAAADFIVEVFLPMEPGEPQGLVATAGDGQVSLSWEAPASDGGAVITDYEVRHALGESVPPEVSWSPAGVDLTEEITGLRNNEEYTFEVRAVNSVSYGNAASTRATPMEPSIGLCDRTPAVKQAILSSIGGGVACGDVTHDQLGRISSLDLSGEEISSLQAADFSGLSSLTTLHLNNNQLSSLATGIFSGLSRLTRLDLDDNRLGSLPAGVFYGLSSLTSLDLDDNRLGSLPAGVFYGLSSLTSLDLNNNRLTSLPAEVFSGLSSLTSLNLDNNSLDKGVTISPAAVTVPVNSSGTYEVVLNAPPSNDATVTVSLSSSDVTVASVAPASLSFTASGTGLALVDWNLPKRVVVDVPQAAAADSAATLSHQASSSDTSYNGISVADVTVTVADTVQPTVLLHAVDNLFTGEDGGTTSFQVSLSIPPSSSSSVSLTLASNDPGEGTVAPASLTFLPGNWNESQTVTVTGVDDEEADGHQSYQITFALSSGDPRYDGLSVGPVSVTNRDNEPLLLNQPTLSVDDAHAQESSGTPMIFTVRLSRPATSTVTVAYATQDGSATAGLDYTATSGQLSFAPGQQSRTIAVPILEDEHDDSPETFSLLLSNTSGARILDGVGEGVIRNSDPIPQAWMARFGRSVAQQLVDAVETRLNRPPQPGLQWSLAGYQPEGGELVDNERLASWLLKADSLTADALVEGTSFALTPRPGLAVWGNGSIASFAGDDGPLSTEGEVVTALLAGDWGGKAWTAGAALAHSRGDGSYNSEQGDGEVSSNLSGIYPYAHYRPSPRLSLWGMAGYGAGELTVTPEGEKELETTLNLSLAAVGIHTLLVDGGGDGFSVSSKADALLLKTTSEATEGLSSAEATVSRLRWGLQADRPFSLPNDASLTVSGEMALRSDGGDADSGVGADLGAALLWTAPRQGITAELQGQALLFHGAEGFEEKGLSASLSWSPAHLSENAPTFSLRHRLGGEASGGMDRLLSPISLEEGDVMPTEGEGRLEAIFSSAPLSLGKEWSIRPEIGFSQSSILREYSLGATLSPLHTGEDQDWKITVERLQKEGNDAAPSASHALSLHFSLLL